MIKQFILPASNKFRWRFFCGRSYREAAYYIDKEAHIEDEQRSYFDINLRNTQLENIGDFVVAGGFGRFNIDNVQHNGVMNLYVHGGNTRLYRKTPHWEYGFKNLDERINRTDKDNPRRRWKYSKAVDVGLGRELVMYLICGQCKKNGLT
ncbi:hypothetical protein A4A71_09525 [Nicoletella semolina]|uniref:hypothetical protein n=1 Tax=Nicoletella semolina TaxID=271160 RepID=UPI00244BA64E|nr:hypothetical protein [Nicoletella semolina]MDH2925539.1 hypothetical protein [Nicoletella semolina]